jgi:hypothetical protein
LAEIGETFKDGNLKEVAEMLTNPARSGVFLSRARIRRLGFEMGLRSGVQNRSRMLENLFREAGAEGRIEELIERLEAEADLWLGRFKGWSKECAPAKAAWRDWSGRARELRRSLGKARKWARDMKEEAPGASLQPPG